MVADNGICQHIVMFDNSDDSIIEITELEMKQLIGEKQEDDKCLDCLYCVIL